MKFEIVNALCFPPQADALLYHLSGPGQRGKFEKVNAPLNIEAVHLLFQLTTPTHLKLKCIFGLFKIFYCPHLAYLG